MVTGQVSRGEVKKDRHHLTGWIGTLYLDGEVMDSYLYDTKKEAKDSLDQMSGWIAAEPMVDWLPGDFSIWAPRKRRRRRAFDVPNPRKRKARRKKNPSGCYAKLVAEAEKGLKRKLTAAEKKKLKTAIREYKQFHGCEPSSGKMVKVPKGTGAIVVGAGEVTETNYKVPFAGSARKGQWTHLAGDHGRTSRKTKAPFLAWVPGKKAPPLFAQARGSDLRFKPSHGIVG